MVRKSHSEDDDHDDDDVDGDVDLLLKIVAVRLRQGRINDESPDQQQSTHSASVDLTIDDASTSGCAMDAQHNDGTTSVGQPMPRNNDNAHQHQGDLQDDNENPNVSDFETFVNGKQHDIETNSRSNFDDETAAGPVPPMFLAASYPGAFAVGGLSDNSNNHYQDATPSSNNSCGNGTIRHLVDGNQDEQQLDSDYMDDEEEGETAELITAQAVEDDDEPSSPLPNAEPMAIAGTTTRSKRKLFLLLSLEVIGALVLVAIVLVVLILSIQHKQAHDDTTNGRMGEQHKGMIPIMEATTSTHAPPPITLLESLNLPQCTLQALENPRSPQSQAFAWLSNNHQKEGGDIDIDLPLWRLKQRYALAVFYHAMRGGHWVQNDGWLDWEIDECKWEQSTTDWDFFEPFEFLTLQVCNDGGEIIGLRFHKENNLDGSIPPEISLLGHSLQSLDIRGGLKVKETLPSEVGLLTSLTSLRLFATHLTGTLPSELGLLGQSLTELWLARTQIHGMVPSELGKLSKLEILGLQDTGLSGSLPGEMTSLKKLFLTDSPQLSTGSILLEITTKLHKLDELYLWTSPGTTVMAIPSQIGQMTELKRLIIADWQIHGQLPSEFAKLTELRSLSLNENSIPGFFPQVIATLSELEDLNIVSNRFEGKLQSAMFSKLTNLKLLRMEKNSFSGSLPTGMFTHMTMLEVLSVNDNEFTGTLPTEVGLQSSLRELGLQNTNISGTLPTELFLLNNLTTLVVTNTSLSGSIPDVLCSKILPPQEIKCFGGNCYGVATSNISACHGTDLCGCNCDPCGVRD